LTSKGERSRSTGSIM